MASVASDWQVREKKKSENAIGAISISVVSEVMSRVLISNFISERKVIR